MVDEKISENDVIKFAQKGDIKCQDILYDKYKKGLTKYIKDVYNPKDNVEDIVSDILIKVFLNLNKYNINKSDFKTWVFNIMKNHMVDLWRKKNPDIIYDDIHNESVYLNSTIINHENDYMDCAKSMMIENNINKSDFFLLEMKYIYGFSYLDMSYYSDMSASKLANKINYIKSKIKTPVNR